MANESGRDIMRSYREVTWNQYLLKVIKNTTRCERIACAASIFALLISVFLIVYFSVIIKNDPESPSDAERADQTIPKPSPPPIDTSHTRAPHEWNITREMWLAQYSNNTRNDEYSPLRVVIINHSVSPECHTFINCAAELRNLQTWFLNRIGYDVPYNFFIGNDGRVYEGRGWGFSGAHTPGFNFCSLGVGFVGDYRPETTNTIVTDEQVERFNLMMAYGVKQGYLHPEYTIIGARDIDHTSESPGYNLYNLIKKWPHYQNHTKSCTKPNITETTLVDQH